MRVLYFHRDDSVHDRRFLDALGKLPLEVIDLQLENRVKLAPTWKPPANVYRTSWPGAHNDFSWFEKPRLVRELKRICKEYHPDVIHAGQVDLCAYLAASAGLKPLVTMSWGYDLLFNTERHLSSKRRARYALQKTAILLDDCQTVSRKAERLGFPSERIVTFPWGINLKTFHPRKIQMMNRDLNKHRTVVLLSTRQMEKIYGCDVIIKAFIKAAKEEEKLRLVMLAEGSQKEQFMRQISMANLNDRVNFMGVVPEKDMIRHFHNSDIYVSASHVDGSSISLLQSMACAVPPLVSDIPGNQEWVKHGENGWLFKDGSSDELASLMVEVSRLPRQHKALGAAARKTVIARADWQRNSPRLMEAYRMAISFTESNRLDL